ncbi:hypothetical protein SCHPADRAFT_940308 [Schizopora paradoxa]|uniref:Uncharacterized protein n=1 Tax=Schizopora paradoxa TaxID=27342 RepID=A0A0H2S9J2_9AGAM|nr:hypothetical protein SCHPADRAFT_940308 [Schizopora paradoxa]
MIASKTGLFRRKGGGGGHGGSSHGSSSSGKGGSSGGSKGSPAASKGAPKTFTTSRYSNSFSLGTSKGKSTATPYSTGGGKSSILSSGMFSGRLSGGGSRTSVYGSRVYGSGYPYGGYGYYVSDRPFPYVFIPVPIHRHYYGCDEYYDNVTSTDRPGGNLVSAIVQPSYDTSSVTYRLVGDNNSVSAVFAAVVANCSVANNTGSITAFTPSSDESGPWPLPEQVIQWYRASSFALTLDGYNNTAALASNQPSSNSSMNFTRLGDTALPANLNMTFLNCINYTTGASVPLTDPSSDKLTSGQIAGIVIGGIVSAFLLFLLGMVCADKCRARRQRKQNRQRILESDGDWDFPDEAPKPYRKGSVFGRMSKFPFARKMGYKPVVVEEKMEENAALIYAGGNK